MQEIYSYAVQKYDKKELALTEYHDIKDEVDAIINKPTEFSIAKSKKAYPVQIAITDLIQANLEILKGAYNTDNGQLNNRQSSKVKALRNLIISNADEYYDKLSEQVLKDIDSSEMSEQEKIELPD